MSQFKDVAELYNDQYMVKVRVWRYFDNGSKELLEDLNFESPCFDEAWEYFEQFSEED